MPRRWLEGKVAIVTGSSRGIGRETARLLLAHGARVVINGRDPERLEQTRQDLGSAGRVLAVTADVSTRGACDHLVTQALRAFGSVDTLVANAGVSMRGRFEEIAPEVFRRILEQNVLGSVYPAQAALPALRASCGSILFVSSVAGIRGLAMISAYSAAKMALTAVAQSLRMELAGSGVHVGIVYVGMTRNDPGKQTVGPQGQQIVLAPRTRLAQPQERVAAAILRALRARRAWTVLTGLGWLNAISVRLIPGISERLTGWYLRRQTALYR
jgi:NAD(P)-dependent dehydrogenase (short-subunit alcohol dehydrogenase family)